MNNTLNSILIAGALTLGYNTSRGQTWNQAHYDEYERRVSYQYQFIPKDTLEGVVLEKKKSRNNILDILTEITIGNKLLKNPYKVTILTRDKEGNYFLLKEKSEGYRYKNLKEGSLLQLQRANVIEKKYFLEEHKRDKYDPKKKKYRVDRYDINNFQKGKYIGIRSKLVAKNWSSEEYNKIINQKTLEEYRGIKRVLNRIEKRQSRRS